MADTVTVNGCTYAYEDTGTPDDVPEGAPGKTILFGHAYLMTQRMWDRPVELLKDRYRCITFDWRGQGETEVTEDGYDVSSLADDAVGLLDALGVDEPVHYVGLSMGGYVGFDLLLRHEDRLRTAALLDTSAQAEPTLKRIKYQAMLRTVKSVGYEPVIDRVKPLMFSPTFRRSDPDAVEAILERVQTQDRTGIYRAGQGIFSRDNRLPDLGRVRTPVLLITGADDEATPPDAARHANDALPNSQFILLPDTGHISVVERPDVIVERLTQFWAESDA